MKYHLRVALSFVLACSQGCRENDLPDWSVVAYQAPDDPTRVSAEIELRELIIRKLLSQPHPDEDICFIAFGYADNEDWIDPPPTFLKRLADLPLDIRPVSQARLPRTGERKNAAQARGVEEMNTGEDASIYYVHLRRWIDESSVELDFGRYGGPLDGGGVHGAVYEVQDAQWQPRTEGQAFVS